MSEQITILHLSDLHFGMDLAGDVAPAIVVQRTKMMQALDKLLAGLSNRLCPDIVVISGDIGWRGRHEDYLLAAAWIKEKILRQLNLTPDDLILCPGNHDLERSRVLGMGVPTQAQQADRWLHPDNLANFIRPFTAYNDFYRELGCAGLRLGDRWYNFPGRIDLKGVQFLILNSAWFSRSAQDQGRLWLGLPHLETLLQSFEPGSGQAADSPLTIAVCHHPPSWLHAEEHQQAVERASLFDWLRGRVHFMLTGHAHGTTGLSLEQTGGSTVVFSGGATYADKGYRCNFALYQVDQAQSQLHRCGFEFDHQRGSWLQHYDQPYPLCLSAEAVAAEVGDEGVVGQEDRITRFLRWQGKTAGHSVLSGLVGAGKAAIPLNHLYVPLRAMLDLRWDELARPKPLPGQGNSWRGSEKNLDIPLLEAVPEMVRRARSGVVVLGAPGAGKSGYLRQLLLSCDEGGGKVGLPDEVVPIFLPIAAIFDEKFTCLSELIRCQVALFSPDDPSIADQLLAANHLLLLIDGLDEIADLEARRQAAALIRAGLTPAGPSISYVVTSRFAGYEKSVYLGVDFLHLQVRPLSESELERFIRTWYRVIEQREVVRKEAAARIARERSGELLTRLAEPDFQRRKVFELTRNPFYLTIFCLLHRYRGTVLPNKRIRLLEECLIMLLEDWRQVKRSQSGLSAHDARRALQPAALRLHITPGKIEAKVALLAPAVVSTLKGLDSNQATAVAFLETMRQDCGVLVGQGEQYGYLHHSFQEYLAARELRGRAFRDPEVLSNLAVHFGKSWWREVGILLFGLEDPSLFEPYMSEVLRLETVLEAHGLLEFCLDEAAEVSAQPFLELITLAPGKNKNLWQRQLACLRLLVRLSPEKLDGSLPLLSQHPSKAVREWLEAYQARKQQAVIYAEKGGYELVAIPAGEFMMGSPAEEVGRYEDEGPYQQVAVADFYLGRYPVTNREYEQFLKENPTVSVPLYWGDRRFNLAEQPVVGVSWVEANQYATWAGLRLPTEAEWEYGCRAGTATPYYAGELAKDLKQVAWYDENAKQRSHMVGSKAANSFSLHDMHGNVWEWVEDDYYPQHQPVSSGGQSDPVIARGTDRVIRGGSWVNGERSCRSAVRYGRWADDRGNFLGFRLARSKKRHE